ncbi:MAG TPA: alpha/beta hydrolase [Myxococcota bacterium]
MSWRPPRRLLPLIGLLSGGLVAACVTPGPRTAKAPEVDARGEGFVDVGDAWLRVKDTGPKDSGKVPLILVHGFGARLDNWSAVQDALDDDRRVISFDQKGFGQSERPDGDYGPDKHGRDLLKVMDLLGIEHAVLAGHSYGGGVVMRATLAEPDRVDGVVLVDAFILERQIPTSFRWAKAPVLGEAIFSVLFTELPGEKYVMAFHDGQRFTSTKVLDEVHAMQSREGSTYAQLSTVRGMHYGDVEGRYLDAVKKKPRGVVWGDDDRVTPLRDGKAVAASIDAPLTIVADAGHVPLIERPALVIAEIERVLAVADDTLAKDTTAWKKPTTTTDSSTTTTTPDASTDTSKSDKSDEELP